MNKSFVYALQGFYPSLSKCHQDGFNFELFLKKDFACIAKRTFLDESARTNFQKIGEEEILKALNFNWKQPYIFHEKSLLLSQISIKSDGRWLSTSFQEINSLEESTQKNYITYISHNIDTPTQAYGLLALFNKWIYYTDVFLK